MELESKNCHVCGSNDQTWLKDITKKPLPEVEYNIPVDKYFRQIYMCNTCGVINNFHSLLDLETFYSGEYNQAIESNQMKKRFERIIAIDEKSSDNKSRVKRVRDYLMSSNNSLDKLKALDVGSGTCVFLYELKKVTDITTYCIDPDPVAVAHSIENAGVDGGFNGTIFDFPNKSDKFDLISFNKVLEHVKNPIEILEESIKYLNEHGVLYIELPESDRIIAQNIIEERAEFAVEHFTVHNPKSLAYIADQLHLKITQSDIITDPSGKFTIYAFMEKQ